MATLKFLALLKLNQMTVDSLNETASASTKEFLCAAAMNQLPKTNTTTTSKDPTKHLYL
jgi:hypothetical protein